MDSQLQINEDPTPSQDTSMETDAKVPTTQSGDVPDAVEIVTVEEPNDS